ncbi:MAG: hypothetical protein PVSMB8_09530 [Vulcanimicrobiaceae bacterium]
MPSPGSKDTIDPEELRAWGKDLEAERALIFRTSDMVIARVKKFWSGDDGDQFVSPYNGDPVKGPVLEFEEGHSMNVDPKVLIQLSADGLAYYEICERGLARFLEEAAKFAASKRIPPIDAARILVGAIRRQASIIVTGLAKEEKVDG